MHQSGVSVRQMVGITVAGSRYHPAQSQMPQARHYHKMGMD